eukprot:510543_1
MNDLINLTLFYMLWIFLSCNIHWFWFAMEILGNKAIKLYLFQDITHENVSLLLQTFVAVVRMNCGPAIEDINTKESAQHGMDICTTVGAEQYLIYCATAHKKLDNKMDTKSVQAKKYWICEEIFYVISVENIAIKQIQKVKQDDIW